MDRDAFAYLYLHANSLAELGRARFADLAAADDAGAAPPAPDSASDPLPPPDAGTDTDDFDTYLGRIYAGRDQLTGRIDALHSRLAPDELQALAERLPRHLPSLQAPLDGRGLSAWLDRYAEGDEDLHDIVQRIRCADT